MKACVEKHSKSTKTANEIEKNLLKIAIKTFYAVEDKKITLKDLLVCDKPFRAALEVFIKCFNYAKVARNIIFFVLWIEASFFF